LFRALGPGYMRSDEEVHSGHTLAVMAVFVFFLIYVGMGVATGPWWVNVPELPVLALVATLMTCLLWTLGLMSFWLDRFLVPLLFTVFVCVSITHLWFAIAFFLTMVAVGVLVKPVAGKILLWGVVIAVGVWVSFIVAPNRDHY